jgi:hypothetical protein
VAARRTEAGDGYFLSSICFGGKSIPQRERVLTRLHGRASRGLTRARSARVVPTAHGSLVVTPRVQLKRTRYRENCFIEGKNDFNYVSTLAARDISDLCDVLIRLLLSSSLRDGAQTQIFGRCSRDFSTPEPYTPHHQWHRKTLPAPTCR